MKTTSSRVRWNIALGVVIVACLALDIVRRRLSDEVAGAENENHELAANTAAMERQVQVSSLLSGSSELAPLARAAVPTNESDRLVLEQLEQWTKKVDVVRKELEAHPEKSIPEMALLHEDDFFDIVKDYDVIGDPQTRDRRIAGLRSFSKLRFSKEMFMALGQYVQANPGRPLSTPLELKPYFRENAYFKPTQVTDEMLERYKVTKNSAVSPAGIVTLETVLLEDEPVNSNDQRIEFTPRVYRAYPPGMFPKK